MDIEIRCLLSEKVAGVPFYLVFIFLEDGNCYIYIHTTPSDIHKADSPYSLHVTNTTTITGAVPNSEMIAEGDSVVLRDVEYRVPNDEAASFSRPTSMSESAMHQKQHTLAIQPKVIPLRRYGTDVYIAEGA